MPRSASTWSYNVCRLLALKCGRRSFASYANSPEALDRELDRLGKDHDLVVLKFHLASERAFQLLAAGRAVNVFTFRHPLAAIASWRDIFGLSLEAAVDAAREALQDMDRFRSLPGTLFVSMREVVESTAAATDRIAVHLGLGLRPNDIMEVAAATSNARMAEMAESLRHATADALVDIGFSRYDPVTHLHVGHFKRGLAREYQQDLTEDEIARCRAALAPWFPGCESW